MTDKKELRTPLTVFEPKESNQGAEFLISFIGPELAYPLIRLLAEESEASEELAKVLVYGAYTQSIKKYFPNLSPELVGNTIFMREHLVKANAVIDYLQRIAFSQGKHIFSLLNPVAYTTTDHYKRVKRLLTQEPINTRYRYELLRQEVLMLTSLAYSESRYGQRTIENLNDLNDLFENALYTGSYGENHVHTCYSLHNSTTNDVLAVASNPKNFSFIDEKATHCKHHTLIVRKIDGIGPVLVRQREKSTESALIKAIYKGSQMEEPFIDIRQITDPSGFMFVTEENKNELLMGKIMDLIKKQFPEARIQEDNIVDKNRNQSTSVSWLRIQVYLHPTDMYPIELIVFSQMQYFHYLYHLGEEQETESTVYPNATAHTLYELRRSYRTADILFPQEIYHQDPTEIAEHRKADQKMQAAALLRENRITLS